MQAFPRRQAPGCPPPPPPPLRTRGEDILTLFNRYSEQFAEEYGCEAPQ